MINNVKSQYTCNITSITGSVRDITSTIDLNVESKSTLDIVSLAKKADGAGEIMALAGAFGACHVDNWKAEKSNYLREHY